MKVGVVSLTPLKKPYIDLLFEFVNRVVTTVMHGKRKAIQKTAGQLFPSGYQRAKLTDQLFAMTDLDRDMMPDGYSQILRFFVFGPSGFWTMAPLRYAPNLIPSFPWIAPPRPPPWQNPRQGRDEILPSGNPVHDYLRSRAFAVS